MQWGMAVRLCVPRVAGLAIEMRELIDQRLTLLGTLCMKVDSSYLESSNSSLRCINEY